MPSSSVNVRVGVETDVASLKRAEAKIRGTLDSISRFNKSGLGSKQFTQPLGKITASADEFTKSLEASNARVLAFGASAGAIYAVQAAMTALVKTTISVEKEMADINVILGATTGNLKKFGNELFNIAGKTGQSWRTVAEAAKELSRQGLGVEKTLQRTHDAMILARLGGMEATAAVESLTAAINTFDNAALNSTRIINKLANVDAAFAVSTEDLAEAIKRVGSSAKDAGLSFDEMLAAITTAQQKTARGGRVIGNSLKTIFTRVQRPRVIQQFDQLGVAVKDAAGNIRPAMAVLQDFSKVYDTLSDSQRAYSAELLGGVFQINVLKAVMSDLGKEMSVYNRALKVSISSTDQAIARNEELNKTLSALTNETLQNLVKWASEVGQVTFGPAIEKVLKKVQSIIEALTFEGKESLASSIGKGFLSGLGKIIEGPGLILITGLIAKLGANFVKFSITAVKTFTGLNRAAKQHEVIQNTIQNILIKNPQIIDKATQSNQNLLVIEKELAAVIRQRTTYMQQAEAMSKRMAANISASAVIVPGKGPSKGKAKGSGGVIPNFAVTPRDRTAEVIGAASNGYKINQRDVRQTRITGLGDVVYNSKEKIKEFPGMSQQAIVPPRGSRAGQNYKEQFQATHGFNPYSSEGHIPNFARAERHTRKVGQYRTKGITNKADKQDNLIAKITIDRMGRTIGAFRKEADAGARALIDGTKTSGRVDQLMGVGKFSDGKEFDPTIKKKINTSVANYKKYGGSNRFLNIKNQLQGGLGEMSTLNMYKGRGQSAQKILGHKPFDYKVGGTLGETRTRAQVRITDIIKKAAMNLLTPIEPSVYKNQRTDQIPLNKASKPFRVSVPRDSKVIKSGGFVPNLAAYSQSLGNTQFSTTRRKDRHISQVGLRDTYKADTPAGISGIYPGKVKEARNIGFSKTVSGKPVGSVDTYGLRNVTSGQFNSALGMAYPNMINQMGTMLFKKPIPFRGFTRDGGPQVRGRVWEDMLAGMTKGQNPSANQRIDFKKQKIRPEFLKDFTPGTQGAMSRGLEARGSFSQLSELASAKGRKKLGFSEGSIPNLASQGKRKYKKKKWHRGDVGGKEKQSGGFVPNFARKVLDSDYLNEYSKNHPEKYKALKTKYGVTNVQQLFDHIALEAGMKGQLSTVINAPTGAGKTSLAMGSKGSMISSLDQLNKGDNLVLVKAAEAATGMQKKPWWGLQKRYLHLEADSEEVHRRRKLRDAQIKAGVSTTAFGRKAGSTRGAGTSFGAMESLVAEEMGKKAGAFKSVRSDSNFKLSGVPTSSIPLPQTRASAITMGAFSPPTLGHDRLFKEMEKSGLYPYAGVSKGMGRDFDIGLSIGEKTKLLKSAYPNINFGQSPFGRGAPDVVRFGNEATRFDKPKSNVYLGSDRAHDSVGAGFAKAGYSVKEVSRSSVDGLDKNNLSATKVREAIVGNRVGSLKNSLNPRVYKFIEENQNSLRYRAGMLQKRGQKIKSLETARVSILNQMGLNKRLDARSPKRKEFPDLASQHDALKVKKDAMTKKSDRFLSIVRSRSPLAYKSDGHVPNFSLAAMRQNIANSGNANWTSSAMAGRATARAEQKRRATRRASNQRQVMGLEAGTHARYMQRGINPSELFQLITRKTITGRSEGMPGGGLGRYMTWGGKSPFSKGYGNSEYGKSGYASTVHVQMDSRKPIHFQGEGGSHIGQELIKTTRRSGLEGKAQRGRQYDANDDRIRTEGDYMQVAAIGKGGHPVHGITIEGKFYNWGQSEIKNSPLRKKVAQMIKQDAKETGRMESAAGAAHWLTGSGTFRKGYKPGRRDLGGQNAGPTDHHTSTWGQHMIMQKASEMTIKKFGSRAAMSAEPNATGRAGQARDYFDRYLEKAGIAATSKGLPRHAMPNRQPLTQFSQGHVPNLVSGLGSAIDREKSAGYSSGQVKVGYDSRLKSSGGLGVYNSSEGSLGHAIGLHRASGKSMKSVQSSGVPNLSAETGSSFLENARRAGIDLPVDSLKKFTAELNKGNDLLNRYNLEVNAGSANVSVTRKELGKLATTLGATDSQVGALNTSWRETEKSVSSSMDADPAARRRAERKLVGQYGSGAMDYSSGGGEGSRGESKKTSSKTKAQATTKPPGAAPGAASGMDSAMKGQGLAMGLMFAPSLVEGLLSSGEGSSKKERIRQGKVETISSALTGGGMAMMVAPMLGGTDMDAHRAGQKTGGMARSAYNKAGEGAKELGNKLAKNAGWVALATASIIGLNKAFNNIKNDWNDEPELNKAMEAFREKAIQSSDSLAQFMAIQEKITRHETSGDMTPVEAKAANEERQRVLMGMPSNVRDSIREAMSADKDGNFKSLEEIQAAAGQILAGQSRDLAMSGVDLRLEKLLNFTNEDGGDVDTLFDKDNKGNKTINKVGQRQIDALVQGILAATTDPETGLTPTIKGMGTLNSAKIKDKETGKERLLTTQEKVVSLFKALEDAGVVVDKSLLGIEGHTGDLTTIFKALDKEAGSSGMFMKALFESIKKGIDPANTLADVLGNTTKKRNQQAVALLEWSKAMVLMNKGLVEGSRNLAMMGQAVKSNLETDLSLKAGRRSESIGKAGLFAQPELVENLKSFSAHQEVNDKRQANIFLSQNSAMEKANEINNNLIRNIQGLMTGNSVGGVGAIPQNYEINTNKQMNLRNRGSQVTSAFLPEGGFNYEDGKKSLTSYMGDLSKEKDRLQGIQLQNTANQGLKDQIKHLENAIQSFQGVMDKTDDLVQTQNINANNQGKVIRENLRRSLEMMEINRNLKEGGGLQANVTGSTISGVRQSLVQRATSTHLAGESGSRMKGQSSLNLARVFKTMGSGAIPPDLIKELKAESAKNIERLYLETGRSIDPLKAQQIANQQVQAEFKQKPMSELLSEFMSTTEGVEATKITALRKITANTGTAAEFAQKLHAFFKGIENPGTLPITIYGDKSKGIKIDKGSTDQIAKGLQGPPGFPGVSGFSGSHSQRNLLSRLSPPPGTSRALRMEPVKSAYKFPPPDSSGIAKLFKQRTAVDPNFKGVNKYHTSNTPDWSTPRHLRMERGYGYDRNNPFPGKSDEDLRRKMAEKRERDKIDQAENEERWERERNGAGGARDTWNETGGSALAGLMSFSVSSWKILPDLLNTIDAGIHAIGKGTFSERWEETQNSKSGGFGFANYLNLPGTAAGMTPQEITDGQREFQRDTTIAPGMFKNKPEEGKAVRKLPAADAFTALTSKEGLKTAASNPVFTLTSLLGEVASLLTNPGYAATKAASVGTAKVATKIPAIANIAPDIAKTPTMKLLDKAVKPDVIRDASKSARQAAGKELTPGAAKRIEDLKSPSSRGARSSSYSVDEAIKANKLLSKATGAGKLGLTGGGAVLMAWARAFPALETTEEVIAAVENLEDLRAQAAASPDASPKLMESIAQKMIKEQELIRTFINQNEGISPEILKGFHSGEGLEALTSLLEDSGMLWDNAQGALQKLDKTRADKIFSDGRVEEKEMKELESYAATLEGEDKTKALMAIAELALARRITSGTSLPNASKKGGADLENFGGGKLTEAPPDFQNRLNPLLDGADGERAYFNPEKFGPDSDRQGEIIPDTIIERVLNLKGENLEELKKALEKKQKKDLGAVLDSYGGVQLAQAGGGMSTYEPYRVPSLITGQGQSMSTDDVSAVYPAGASSTTTTTGRIPEGLSTLDTTTTTALPAAAKVLKEIFGDLKIKDAVKIGKGADSSFNTNALKDLTNTTGPNNKAEALMKIFKNRLPEMSDEAADILIEHLKRIKFQKKTSPGQKLKAVKKFFETDEDFIKMLLREKAGVKGSKGTEIAKAVGGDEFSKAYGEIRTGLGSANAKLLGEGKQVVKKGMSTDWGQRLDPTRMDRAKKTEAAKVKADEDKAARSASRENDKLIEEISKSLEVADNPPLPVVGGKRPENLRADIAPDVPRTDEERFVARMMEPETTATVPKRPKKTSEDAPTPEEITTGGGDAATASHAVESLDALQKEVTALEVRMMKSTESLKRLDDSIETNTQSLKAFDDLDDTAKAETDNIKLRAKLETEQQKLAAKKAAADSAEESVPSVIRLDSDSDDAFKLKERKFEATKKINAAEAAGLDSGKGNAFSNMSLSNKLTVGGVAAAGLYQVPDWVKGIMSFLGYKFDGTESASGATVLGGEGSSSAATSGLTVRPGGVTTPAPPTPGVPGQFQGVPKTETEEESKNRLRVEGLRANLIQSGRLDDDSAAKLVGEMEKLLGKKGGLNEAIAKLVGAGVLSSTIDRFAGTRGTQAAMGRGLGSTTEGTRTAGIAMRSLSGVPSQFIERFEKLKSDELKKPYANTAEGRQAAVDKAQSTMNKEMMDELGFKGLEQLRGKDFIDNVVNQYGGRRDNGNDVTTQNALNRAMKTQVMNIAASTATEEEKLLMTEELRDTFMELSQSGKEFGAVMKDLTLLAAEQNYEQTKRAYARGEGRTSDVRASGEAFRREQISNSGKFAPEDMWANLQDQMSYDMKDYADDVMTTQNQLIANFKQGTTDALFAAIKGTATLKDAFGAVFQNLADVAMKRTLQMAVDGFMNAVFNSIPKGFSEGGEVKGFARGGIVRGGSGVKDDVPAMLQRGEYVLRKSAVRKYGPEFVQRLNEGGMAGKPEMIPASHIAQGYGASMGKMEETRPGRNRMVRSKGSPGVQKFASGGEVLRENPLLAQLNSENSGISPENSGWSTESKGEMNKLIKNGKAKASDDPEAFISSRKNLQQDMADLLFKNTYAIDHRTRPTKGNFNVEVRKDPNDPNEIGLSALALTDPNNPHNDFKFERFDALMGYLQAKDEHNKAYAEQVKAWKEGKKRRMKAQFINTGISIATSMAAEGLMNWANARQAGTAKDLMGKVTDPTTGEIDPAKMKNLKPKELKTLERSFGSSGVFGDHKGAASFSKSLRTQRIAASKDSGVLKRMFGSPDYKFQTSNKLQKGFSFKGANYQTMSGGKAFMSGMGDWWTGGARGVGGLEASSPFTKRPSVTGGDPYKNQPKWIKQGYESKRAWKQHKNNPQNFAAGGGVMRNSSTMGSDNVPAMLTGGEYVINKKTVQQYGPDFFERLNAGAIRGFQNGGYVGGVATNSMAGGGGDAASMTNNVSIVVNVDSNGRATTATSQSGGNANETEEERSKKLAQMINNSVTSTIMNEKRPGGLLYSGS